MKAIKIDKHYFSFNFLIEILLRIVQVGKKLGASDCREALIISKFESEVETLR